MFKWIINSLASKFIAGETIEEVINKTKELNKRGFSVTINLLDLPVLYCILIKKIHNENLDANISIKLSKFKDVDNVFKLACIAERYNVFMWIDMEEEDSIDGTLKIYKILHKKHDVGVALQTSLDRTVEDIKDLPRNSNIRLCKGAYCRPFFKNEVQMFNECLVQSFLKSHNIFCATHDDIIIDNTAISYKGFNKEFQWLYGVRMNKAQELLEDGYKVRLYLPCGKDWYKYCLRRFKENPFVILPILAKSIL